MPLFVPSLWFPALCCFFCPASISPAATKFFQRHLFSFLFFRGLRNSSLSFVKQSSSFSSKTINKIGKNLCCSAESYRSCNMQHANGCFFAKLFTSFSRPFCFLKPLTTNTFTQTPSESHPTTSYPGHCCRYVTTT